MDSDKMRTIDASTLATFCDGRNIRYMKSLRLSTCRGGGVPVSANKCGLTGETVGSAESGPSGSPFQMPARLAVGLGLGSAPDGGYPCHVPRPQFLGQGCWVPRATAQEGAATSAKERGGMCLRIGYTQDFLRAGRSNH